MSDYEDSKKHGTNNITLLSTLTWHFKSILVFCVSKEMARTLFRFVIVTKLINFMI